MVPIYKICNIGFNIMNIISFFILILSLQLKCYNFKNISLRGSVKCLKTLSTNVFLQNGTSYYHNEINSFCPDELIDNIAGKHGLYFNTTNIYIIKSIMKRYFNHCGAWCLFDYRDPRRGWFWNSTIRDWEYYKQIYKICPNEEYYYAVNKFLDEKYN